MAGSDQESMQASIVDGATCNRRIALKPAIGQVLEDGSLAGGFIPFSKVAKPTLETRREIYMKKLSDEDGYSLDPRTQRRLGMRPPEDLKFKSKTRNSQGHAQTSQGSRVKTGAFSLNVGAVTNSVADLGSGSDNALLSPKSQSNHAKSVRADQTKSEYKL